MRSRRPFLALVGLVAADGVLKPYVLAQPAIRTHRGWVIGLALAVLAAALVELFRFARESRAACAPAVAPRAAFAERHEWKLAAALVGLGVTLRFWHLRNPHLGLFADEAYNGLDAITIRDFGLRPVFLPANLGREALVAYLDAAAIGVFGTTALAIRVVTAIAGSITLFAFYALARKLVPVRTALWALGLFAASKSAIILNRLGLRFNLMLCCEVLTLALLVWGLVSSRRRALPFVLAGLAAGLGAHTYIAYRLFPVVMIAFLLDRAFRAAARERRRELAIAALVAAAVASPLLVYFARNPEAFLSRMERTAAWEGEAKPAALVVGEAAARTLGMFTWSSDRNPRQNVNLEPLLSPFATAGFLVGVVDLLANLAAPLNPALATWWAAAIAPGIFSIEAPHSSRAIGVLPVVFLLTARGLAIAYRIFRDALPRPAVRVVAATVASGIAVTGVVDALVRYPAILEAQGPATTSIWGSDITEAKLARYLNSLRDTHDVYLSPQLFFHPTVEYLTYGKSKHRLWTRGEELSPVRPTVIVLELTGRNSWWLRNDAKKDLFEFWHHAYGLDDRTIELDIRRAYEGEKNVLRENDVPMLAELRARFPEGVERDGGGFTTFEIPAGALAREPPRQ